MVLWLQHQNCAFCLLSGQDWLVLAASWLLDAHFRLAEQIIRHLRNVVQVQPVLLEVTAAYIELHLGVVLCIEFQVVLVVVEVLGRLVDLGNVSRWGPNTG